MAQVVLGHGLRPAIHARHNRLCLQAQGLGQLTPGDIKEAALIREQPIPLPRSTDEDPQKRISIGRSMGELG